MLRFVTDSPWLDVAFTCLGGARSYLGLDVEVDGRAVAATRAERFEGAFRERLLDFGDAPHRLRSIVVHLPPAMSIRLEEVGLADGSRCDPMAGAPGRLLCLGDSITQGMSAISPLSTYSVQLARLLDAELLNQGIGGHVFEADALDATPGFVPSLISVAYGTNDWSRGLDVAQVQANAVAYVERVRALFPNAPVWVVSPLWRASGQARAAGGPNLDEFGAAIREAVGPLASVRAIDGYAMVPHQELYFSDGTHPNELGFMHYAVNVWRAMAHAPQGTR